MIKTIFHKLFGTSNDRIIASMKPTVAQINSLEAEFIKLSDEQLAAKTVEFRKRLKEGTTLDSLLPEAFATVREASKRVLGMRHFDVQLIGGIVLHRGMISEMKTGEGKTLAATAPVYLNALEGKGVHVVTVNDYLVERDTEWMRKIYEFLGLSVGCVVNKLNDEQRQKAYACDVTYGTNNEFGFDYLRDNLKYSTDSMVQRPFNYAIVDEVDSILVDEARTPLIISGPTNDNSKLYTQIDQLVSRLGENDYEVDEKAKTCLLTDAGYDSIEQLLKAGGVIAAGTGLYDVDNINIVHHVDQALKAHKLFQRDVDYIVRDGRVMIIDEFTGRVMEGRRYSEGLHQALEAKEKVLVQNENQTLASVTFQNYFRLYPKLAGMTGTAMTEANEFSDIYRLEVVSIPTHVLVHRKDCDDEIYLTAAEKYKAIVAEIKAVHEKGQPILVGTTSIEKSEMISGLLTKDKIKHNVLNARYHEQEAHIVAQAGRFGAVTIATNMAGRGTDIKLGGNAEMLLQEKGGAQGALQAVMGEVEENKAKVLEAGGLYVLGTERHESRRIDNQLRGRSGRQGDPGKTKFYLSMEDDLMRIFGSDKIKALLSRLGLKEGESITHPWVSKSIEKAQQKVEARNYDMRKTLLRFDDVMNEQRHVIYEQRRYLMSTTDLMNFARDEVDNVARKIVHDHIPANSLPEEWDIVGLCKEAHHVLAVRVEPEAIAGADATEEGIGSALSDMAVRFLEEKEREYGVEVFESGLRHIFIMTLDALWKDHLCVLDHLRTGIGLRAYAQRDPLNEYKLEAFSLFKNMMEEFAVLSVQRSLHLQISKGERKHQEEQAELSGSDERISRNATCPCGSGKKYKYCHGMISQH